MIEIQKKTDELFERWKQQSEKDGYSNFCGDGLMFRGGNWEKEIDGKWYYGKSEGNEEILWEEAPKRILFLLKDTNGNPDCDSREFRPGADGKINLHYKNLAFWLFGLLAFDETKDAPAFDTLNFWEDVFPVFDTQPYAIVNCKKESGGASIDNQTLLNHINNYAQFIKEQILILDPDIIVCGGGSSLIINFVEDNIYPDLVAVNNWICYDEKNNKVVIDSYHPSYWQIEGGSKTIYEDMMSAYKSFLNKYPDFLKNKRKTLEAVREGFYINNTMGIFKKNALEIVSKELTAEFGKKLQLKNCEYHDGRKYIQFWFEPYDKWVEIWDGDNLQLWLATEKKCDDGIEVGNILFSNREWNNSEKYHWYRADGHFEFDPKNETEISTLVADAIAVLNNLITFHE